jgi:hypothetical protein
MRKRAVRAVEQIVRNWDHFVDTATSEFSADESVG